MHLSGKGITRGAMACAIATVLTACGGGGGGGDGGGNSPLVPNPTENLRLTFSADRTSLPLNIAGEAPAIGSAYTSTVTLRSSFVPGGGTQGGNCWTATFAVISGAASGALATTAGVGFDPTQQFQISTSGSWTVLLNSTAQAGTVVIEAAVPNPDTATVTCNDDRVEIGARFAGTPISYIRQQYSITVGQASGKASQIRVNTVGGDFLFAQNTGGTTQLRLQAQVLDEAGQRVPDPASGARNVYVAIVDDPTSAVDNDAIVRAVADGGSRKWAVARTVNGQADFSIVSGTATGTLVVDVIADRFDNNVDNGITEPVRNRFSVPVVVAVGQEALAVGTATALPGANEGRPYATVLSATGGVPPYSWITTAGSVLPAGLGLASDGVITGTPTVNGSFRFAVTVSDSSTLTQSVTREFSLNIAPATGLLAIETSSLASGTEGVFYASVLNAAGGTPPYTWSATQLPTNLAIAPATGVISGTPSAAGTYPVVVTLTDGKGTVVRKDFSIVVAPPPAP